MGCCVRTHRIVNLSQCLVLDPRLDGLLAPLKADLDASGVEADHDLLWAGFRHLGLRVIEEVLITL